MASRFPGFPPTDRGSNVWWMSWKIRCCRFPIGARGSGKGGWWMRQDDDDFSKHGDGENLFFPSAEVDGWFFFASKMEDSCKKYTFLLYIWIELVQVQIGEEDCCFGDDEWIIRFLKCRRKLQNHFDFCEDIFEFWKLLSFLFSSFWPLSLPPLFRRGRS